MPIYPYICTVCEYPEEIVADRKDRNKQRFCPHCDSPMRRALEEQTVTMRGDIEPGYDESLGMHVSSRRDLREKLAYSNAYCPEWNIGEPSAGRLTKEERAIEEGRPTQQRKTIFERREEPGWGNQKEGWDDESIGRQRDRVGTEGTANYKALIDDIKGRQKNKSRK